MRIFPRKTSAKKAQGGFILVEAIVACFVVGIGLAAALGSIAYSVKAQKTATIQIEQALESRNDAQATWLR